MGIGAGSSSRSLEADSAMNMELNTEGNAISQSTSAVQTMLGHIKTALNDEVIQRGVQIADLHFRMSRDIADVSRQMQMHRDELAHMITSEMEAVRNAIGPVNSTFSRSCNGLR